MKKLLITLGGLALLNCANAYTTENLDKIVYTCNGAPISYNSTESTIQNNCHKYSVKHSRQITGGDNSVNLISNQPTIPVVDTGNDITDLDRVEFTTDSGIKMKCFYRANKLYKCKAKNPKKPQIESAT